MSGQTIDELALDVGRWVALETVLFETLGTWARSSEVAPPARRALGTWCHRHAWHADLWRDRMPAIAHHELPSEDGFAFVDSTRAAIEEDARAIIDPVLPGIAEQLAVHRQRIDPLLDGPTARILSLVAADVALELTELRGALPAPAEPPA